MREHAIPTDVVGYRFHIVGNMTIKQFAEVGAGCLVGFIIYSTNLFPLLKWPLIGISAGVGVLAAFVPFEERPLDHWIVTFIRVIYRPTQFFWRRVPKIPDPFLFQPSQNQPQNVEMDLTPARHQRIKEYLSTLNKPEAPDQFALAEQQRLQSIMSTFSTMRVAVTSSTKKAERPQLIVKPRSLRELDQPEADTVPAAVVPDYTWLEQAIAEPQPIAQQLIDKPMLSVNQVATQIAIPEIQNIAVDAAPVEAVAETVAENTDPERAYLTPAADLAALGPSQAQAAAFNIDLPFPSKPTEPNKLVGMVLTAHQDLVNDAIVEIKNDQGKVMRAVKTNALGQFFVSTPLPNGTYHLLTEKDELTFQPIQLTLSGKVVDPIEIRSVV